MKRRQASPEQWNYGQISLSSRIFDTANYIFLFLLCVLMIYPLWYVLCCSFSDPALLMRHSGILLWPLDFSFAGYEKVLNYKQLWNSYVVTIFVVIAGTAMNMLFSILFAFVLSRKGMMWHKLITGLAVFTMYFSGGMIPTYLVVKSVGLYDTVWAMIIPGLISTYNCIILRTAFYGIPDSLEESAKIDGAGDLRVLFTICVPLIVPSIATVALFYAVGHWNSWSAALLYIRDEKLMPLQMVLRALLIQGEAIEVTGGQDLQTELNNMLLKYVVIVVSTIPILCVYPFIQRFFTKGVMIGAVKG
ncbi:MAG: carbohydrate ABC transporter permease [Clostridia bacterium]|nr:carbohydrate ABC transporter permease [Clostridia bacterium]